MAIINNFPFKSILVIPKDDADVYQYKVLLFKEGQSSKEATKGSLQAFLCSLANLYLRKHFYQYSTLEKGTTWLTLLRQVAKRISAASEDVLQELPQLTAIQQFEISCKASLRNISKAPPIPSSWNSELKSKLPFVVYIHTNTQTNTIVRLIPNAINITTTIEKEESFPDAWVYQQLISQIPEETRNLRVAIESSKIKDNKFLDALKHGLVVQGKGEYAGYSIQQAHDDSLEVRIRVPAYLQEAVEDKFILWGEHFLVCRTLPSKVVDIDYLKKMPVVAIGKPGYTPSEITSHCFISDSHKVCTGVSTDRWLAAANAPSLVDCLLHGRLLIASRTLRSGHRQNNTNTLHNNYHSIFKRNEENEYYRVFERQDAERYAKTNAIQLVRYV
ncbi:hypothetical protein TI05_06355 [Achromatium sp. WMS3]|nr:hypothetical protein TI05_06355 [Achromatium sp. WMS3]